MAKNQETEPALGDERATVEALQKALAEKEVLVKEMHHRVKNNYQVISSLLHLQAAAAGDPRVAALFQESRNRVQSMALLHELLYQAQGVAQMDFAAYLRRICTSLFHSYGVSPETISLSLEINQALPDVDSATACGLLVNELVSNCLKHAFPDGRKGEIHITFHTPSSPAERGDKKGELQLVVRDNGVGLPKAVDFRRTESLGLHLVRMLGEQLRGKVKLHRRNGTEFRITFPAGGDKVR